MLDQKWAMVITVLMYLIAHFYIAKPILQRFSVKIKGRNFITQSPTTFDLKTADGGWDALMNIFVLITALFIALLLHYLGSEIGLFHKMY